MKKYTPDSNILNLRHLPSAPPPVSVEREQKRAAAKAFRRKRPVLDTWPGPNPMMRVGG